MRFYACFIGFCLLAGTVSADYAWETGKQYRYKVSTRALSGISEFSNQFAGVQLTFDQIVTGTGSNTVNVKTENLKAIEVNEDLDQGFRQGQIDQGREVSIPAEVEQYLTSPMDITVVKGVVESIRVEKDLPNWAINIKKAQASTFTVDTTGKNVVVEGNLNRKSNSIRPEQANQESGYFFEVLEQTVHGECEVYYTVSQNGPFDYPYQFQKQAQAAGQTGQAGQYGQQSSESSSESQEQTQSQKQYGGRKGSSQSSSSSSSEEESVEKPWPQAFDQLCGENDQVFEIIKTVNFTTCVQKPVVGFSSPSGHNFRAGANAGGTLWTRALITRLIACGQSRQNYTILKITQEEQFQTGLEDKEKVVAGAQKNVTLVSIRSGHPSPVHNPRTIKNLVYSFDPKEQQQRLDRGNNADKQQQELDSSSSKETTGRYQSQKGSSQEQNLNGVYYENSQSNEQKQYRRTSRFSQEQGQPRPDYYPQGKLPVPTLNEAPLATLLVTRLNRRQLLAHVESTIQEIVQDLTTDTQSEQDSIANRNTLSKITAVVKSLRVLNFQNLAQLARKFVTGGQGETGQVAQRIFVEVLTITGTNPAVKLLSSLIRYGQINGEQAAQALASLPMYVQTPTEQLLRQLFGLLENDNVKANQQTRTSAILAFTTLVHQACVDKKIKNTRYPVVLFGEFCQPELVQRVFVPYFVQKLQKYLQASETVTPYQAVTKQMIFVHLQALSNLGVPEIIPVIQNILNQQFEPIIKVKAIHALEKLLQSHNTLGQQEQQQQQQQATDRQSYDVVTDNLVEKRVLPILVSVAFNRGEHPEVRVAAFDSLFFCTYADAALWQQIAMSTWFEQSRDVRAFIYNTLQNLAQIQEPLTGTKYAQVQIARQVVNLVKPIAASIARSNNVFTSRFFQPANSGFAQHLQYTASQDSLIPNNVYYNSFLEFGNGAAGFKPLEIGLTGQTFSKLLQEFYNGLDNLVIEPTEGNDSRLFSEIQKKLNITFRKQNPLVANVFVNVRNEIQRMFTLDGPTVWKSGGLLAGIFQNITRGIEVNYQKVALWSEQSSAMPTILGIPLVYKESLPSLFSVRGTIKGLRLPNGGFQVQVDLSLVLSGKFHRQLAFKCPVTGRKYQSGVQRKLVAEIPLSAVLLKGSTGEIQFAVTPAHLNQKSPSGTIDLLTYQQKPYTAIIQDEFYPLDNPKAGQVDIVRVNKEQQDGFSRTLSFGQNSLRLDFQVQEKSDYPKEVENVSGWVNYLRQFQPFSTFKDLGYVSSSIRYVQRKLVLNLNQSKTNTVLLVAGTKLKRVSIAEKLQSSEEASSDENTGFSSSSGSEKSQMSHIFSSPSARKHQYFNKQQGQQSASESESQENQSQNQQKEVTQQATQNVVAFALLGKKDALLPLKSHNGHTQQLQSSSEEQQQQQSYSNEQQQQSYSNEQQQKQQSYSNEQQQKQQSYSNEQQQKQQSYSNEQQQQQQAYSNEQQQQQNPHQLISEQQNQQQLQRPLQKGSPSTVQYLFQFDQSVKGDIFLRVALGDAANQAAKALPQSKSLQVVQQSVVDSPNDQCQADLCIQLQGYSESPKRVSRHVIAYTRKSLLEQELKPYFQLDLEAGSSCDHSSFTFGLGGWLRRDQEMAEWAQTKSLLAQRCSADEKKGFSVSQVCLEVAAEQAAAYNNMLLGFNHSGMPPTLKNYTAQFVTLLKTIGYDYLSEDLNFSADNDYKIVKFHMTPNKQYVSFQIELSQSILKFENIKTNQLLRTVLPLTATNTLAENIQRRLFRSQYQPTCQLEGKYVSTFDNVTYSFNKQVVQGCQTVLVHSTSYADTVAVLVKDIQKEDQQVVTILFGNDVTHKEEKVELIPRGAGAGTKEGKTSTFNKRTSSAEALTVLINGKQVQLPYTIRGDSRNEQPVAEIMVIPNGGVQVIGRNINVASDGRRIVLQAEGSLRNETFGICGNLNEEKSADLLSPRNVPLSSGSLLVASYSLGLSIEGQGKSQGQTGGNKCQIHPRYQRQVKQEEEQYLSYSGNQESSTNQPRQRPYIPVQQLTSPGLTKNSFIQGFKGPGYQVIEVDTHNQFSEFEDQNQGSNSNEYQISEEQGEPQRYINENGYLRSAHFDTQTRQGSQRNNRRSGYRQINNLPRLQDTSVTTNAHAKRVTTPATSPSLYSSQNMIHEHQVIRNPQNPQQSCVTFEPLPRCAYNYSPKKLIQKTVELYCVRQGEQVQNIKQQLEKRSFHNFSSQQLLRLRFAFPVQCV